MRALWSCVLLVLLPSILLTNPSGMDVAAGIASLEHHANELRVTVGDRAVLNWQDFSIGSNEVTRFIQPTDQSVVLNRVVGGTSSTIDGLLQANGRLLLLNPAGILIGPTGVIHTAGLVASTLDVMNFDPDAPEGMHFCGGSGAAVANYGRIHAPGGEVVLLGEMVSNHGVIQSDGVRLGAGRDIVLMPLGEQRLIIQPSMERRGVDGIALNQQGRIEAIQAELRADPNPYALAINHGGYVDALCVAEVNGRIRLVADGGRIESTGQLVARNETGVGGTVHLIADQIAFGSNARIDVSGSQGGGTALIGGDYHGTNPEFPTASHLVVDGDVSITADALERGDGGRAILWGKDVCGCFGAVSAQGGPDGGNGGLIEVSGHGWYSVEGARLQTLAPMGRNGTLSFDPVNVTISNNPNAGISANPPPAYVFNGAAGSWNVNVTSLQGFLASNNVEISTSSISGTDPGLAGNIDVNNNVTWATDSLLTMRADSVMTIADGVTVSNTSATAGTNLVMDLHAATLNVGAATNANASVITANNKSIQVSAGAINIIGGAVNTGVYSGIQTVNAGTIAIETSGSVLLQAGMNGATISSASAVAMLVGGNLTLVGGSTSQVAQIVGGDSVSIALAAGELAVMGGNDPLARSGAGSQIEVGGSGTGDVNISLPSGNHGCFGGSAGFAIIQNHGAGDVNMAATGPNCNFLIVGGTVGNLTGSEAQVNVFTGNLSMDLSSLVLQSHSRTSGNTENGGASALIEVERNISVSLTDSLVMTPLANQAESTRIQSVIGSIVISGTEFDVTIGNSFTNIGNLIQTEQGGSIVLGTPFAPAGNITILSTPFQPISPGTLFPLCGLRTDLGGDISVVAVGDLSVTAGANPTNVQGDAGIFPAYNQGVGNLSVIARNISLQGGSNTGTGSATAGLATGSAAGSTGSGDVTVFGTGFLTIQGSAVSAVNNQAQIAAVNGGVVDVTIRGDANLVGGLGAARIYSELGDVGLSAHSIGLDGSTATVQADAGSINLNARQDITLSSGSSLLINSIGNLTALAGRNFSFGTPCIAQVNGGGSMSLVCDNNFPYPPLIGPGEFNISTSAQLNAPGGHVLIYTARREQNQILNGQTINGTTYSEGPLFFDSATEQWLVYYPGGIPPTGPFKIFYKNGPIPTAQFRQEVAGVIGEFFDQLSWFVDSVETPRFPYRMPVALFEACH
jgi:filamentous hemagglutinin family protein